MRGRPEGGRATSRTGTWLESGRAASAETTVAPASRRVASLDGLRGVAAVAVMLDHLILTSTLFGTDPLSSTREALPVWAQVAEFTPLRLPWGGVEAVFIFFVLSGFVLCAPAAGGRPMLWRAYYPRRLLRLYLPLWAAVGLAAALALLTPRGFVGHPSWWLATQHEAIHSPTPVLDDAIALDNPGATNTVLWSLKWEIVFSLALPLYVLLGRALRRQPVAALAGLLLLAGLGAARPSSAVLYLSLFAIGTVLAFAGRDLARWAQRIDRRPARAALWRLLLAVFVLAISSDWVMHGLTDHPTRVEMGIARALDAFAAALAIFLALHFLELRRWLERPVIAWLGSRSFSLYLVHEPIVVSVAMLTPPGQRSWVTPLVALPAALAAAEVFHRYVEVPSLRLARAVGRRCEAHEPAETTPAST